MTVANATEQYQMRLELHRANPCEETADRLEAAWVAMYRVWRDR